MTRVHAAGTRLLVLLDGAQYGAAVFGSPEAARVAEQMAEVLLDAAGVARTRQAAAKRAPR